MVDANVISAKLAGLDDRLDRIRTHCPTKPELLEQDRDAADLVSFNLVLCIQACLDIASHIIADEGWPPAPTLGEAFLRLAERGVLSEPTATALDAAAGMRNILVHIYARIDLSRLHEAATAGLAHLERFAGEVAAWTAGRSQE